MKMQSMDVKNEEVNEQEETVKGTMFSVGFVGFIILLSWILLFVIYMYRV